MQKCLEVLESAVRKNAYKSDKDLSPMGIARVIPVAMRLAQFILVPNVVLTYTAERYLTLGKEASFLATLPKVFDVHGDQDDGLEYKPVTSLFDGSIASDYNVIPYDNYGLMYVSFYNAYVRLYRASTERTGF